MKSLLFLAIALGLIVPNVVFSADAEKRFAVKGAGISSCIYLAKALETKGNSYYVLGGWLEGYLTASNKHLNDTFDMAPWQSTHLMLQALSSYCEINPEANVQQAIDALLQQLGPQRLGSAGQFVVIDDRPEYLFQDEVVVRMKRALQIKGFYAGKIDAVYDVGMKLAVRNFQESIAQPATGMPDQRTLLSLFQP